MPNDPLTMVGTRKTPQSQRADARQVENSAGGYTFQVSAEARLHRFLTLGTEAGTFYVTEQALTKDNADVVIDWAKNRATELVKRIVEVSEAGRAPRNQPALFALAAAIALGDVDGRRAAADALPRVARTGYHLFKFLTYAEQFRGWGPVLRRAVSTWYLGKRPEEQLAYQLIKYRQREGWTHRDALRLAHPRGTGDYRAAFDFACGRGNAEEAPLIKAFRWAQEIGKMDANPARAVQEWVALINANPRLPWEAFPDAALTSPAVWDALLHNGMPQTALMRQLPRLTNLGLLAPMSQTSKLVCGQLTNPELLRKARVHPVSVLLAAKTYASGHSARGSATWTPSAPVIDALNDAFYAAYGAVEPANKRTLIALDVSGSMGSSAGGLPITCREATAAVSLVTAATEPEVAIMGFSHQFVPLKISPKQRLDDAVRSIAGLPFGATDCSLPMVWAEKNRVPVDTFEVLTDNETWAGSIHPHQALESYRQRMGIDARQVVVAITPTDFTIADPEDPKTLDVSGFDSAVPGLIADFSRGDV